ncbi:MAG: DUF7482 domain-containing protein [Armatimonadota bacterium]
MADIGVEVVKRWGGRVLIGVGLWLIVLALGANVFARFFRVHPEAQGQMPGMGTSANPTPPVKGFAKGQEIQFIHTEASDPQVAAMLTRMMGPKVLLVPSLKEIPERLLATVFVFRNGVKGQGPMGFQPDVFDTVPGDARYTPLRRIVLVTWKEGGRARVLRSAEEVRQIAQAGGVSLTTPGIVVNMPMLAWPGGQR